MEMIAKKFGEVVIENFPKETNKQKTTTKNLSPEIEGNCGVTPPVLI